MTDQRTLVERDARGRLVREAWVTWAKTQPDPKPSWLAPWEDLGEPDREADRCIGDAFAAAIEQAEARIEVLESLLDAERGEHDANLADLVAAEARIATCDQIHDAEQAWRMRLNDRLRKAELLADAAERAIEFCDDDEHHGLVSALRSFRTTEDAK